jgi:hypothetical protein
MASKNLFLRSDADKGEVSPDTDLRLRSDADKVGAPPPSPVTQYLAGLNLPEFPHEKDLMANKLPCPPPYD